MEPMSIQVSEKVLLVSRLTKSLCQLKYRVMDLRDPQVLPAAVR